MNPTSPETQDSTTDTGPMALYKFLTIDRQSPTGTGAWTLNRWRSVKDVLVPCENGLHATTADNLIPFLHETLWRVEIGDEYVWHEDASMGRKLVARRMRIVEQVETWNARNARLWACDVAERVLKNFEDRYPDDTRPREAIETARRFARGEATVEELRAAYRAAYSAADRAASRAADSAASRAADSAAYSAASSAASRAADSAASSAAYRAASSAEREWQGRHLAELLGLVWDAPVTEAAP